MPEPVDAPVDVWPTIPATIGLMGVASAVSLKAPGLKLLAEPESIWSKQARMALCIQIKSGVRTTWIEWRRRRRCYDKGPRETSSRRSRKRELNGR